MHESILCGGERFAELLARSDVTPGPDHLNRIASRIAKDLQFVADPTIASIFLTEPIFIAQAAFLEQARISPHNARAVLWVDATLPEIGAVDVFLTVVSEQILHILADEGWRIVACRLEAVDDRRRAGEQVLDALTCRRHCRLCLLTLSDIAPRPNDFDRLTIFVANQALLIVNPARAAILLEKSVFYCVVTLFEQLRRLGFGSGEILGVHATPPEIGIFQIFMRFVTKPVGEVFTDEGRRKISRRLVAVDHRRGRRQQAPNAILGGDERLSDLLARRDVVPGAHHLDGTASGIAKHLQLIANPAIASVLFAEAIFNAEMILLK